MRVVFIGGAGHSGSTMLGLMLGAHPSVAYLGEAKKAEFLGRTDVPLVKRSCKLCGPSCEVWSAFDRPLGIDVYRVLSERLGREVIVDSTKPPDYIATRCRKLTGASVAVSLIVLSRDGRAILNSRLRKYPEAGAQEHIASWMRHMEDTEQLASTFEGPVVRTAYEQLSRTPRQELSRIVAALGLSPVDATADGFWSVPQHPLGGNSGTQSLLGSWGRSDPKSEWYRNVGQRVVPDERWRSELPEDAKSLFDRMAGEFNRPYRDEPAS